VSISVDPNRSSIAATAPLFHGEARGGGGSSIFVMGKHKNAITTLYSNPPNIGAVSQLEFARIYEGEVPGKGNFMAQGQAQLDDATGAITINFVAGKLITGNW